MLTKILKNIQSRPELFILALVVTIIAMLVIPLPTYLVDFLIGLNIVLALLVFMGSFYIERILDFSSFPSILLITTLFRLALSISTSRLVLIEADAGEIISAFGQFVIGDSLVVGFVVFSIVTIVQFIVITKGSERVAEVAARFSLDGMPGKQMSIDADLKAGVIDAEAAKTRRSNLERESQLYGAFDGAMKFIKGDAIAGIIIILVNFIGGVSVGALQHGMTMSEALNTYTILTIGDGLVAQIPALLISISAGFIVTRVSGESDNLGRNIMGQLMGNNFVILVAALLALAIGFLPGFPLMVFVLLSAALGAVYYRRTKAEKLAANAGAAGSGTSADGADGKEGSAPFDVDKALPEAIPLMLLLSETHRKSLEAHNLADRFRSQFFLDFGIRLPQLTVRFSANTEPDRVVVLINEIRAAEFRILIDHFKVVDDYSGLIDLNVKLAMVQEAPGKQSAWIAKADRANVEKMGFALRSDVDEMFQTLSSLLTANINEFFGVQETKNLLDDLEKKYPELLKEAFRHATVQRISEVFQRLLGERISIRNMKLVLEALAQWAPKEKDVIALVEHVRGSLARYISNKFASNGQLRAVVISAQVEELLRKGICSTPCVQARMVTMP